MDKPFYYRLLEKPIVWIYNTRFGEWLEKRAHDKFLNWMVEVDKDTKNILTNENYTSFKCKVCNSEINKPFIDLRKWVKEHRHSNLLEKL